MEIFQFKKNFVPGTPGFFQKNFFCQKYINEMSIDSVFDGDYEFAIIFCEHMYMKNENLKVRVHFGM
jgi:hypothetical protein